MIALCDIGQSGLKSLQRAFEAVGFMAVITSSPEEISRCSHAVLSYGGGFASGFEALRKTRLDRTLRAAAAAGKPVLFIGTGMLLACRSCNQNGLYKGMALLPFDAVGANRETEGFFSTKVTPCALFDREGRQHFYYRCGAYVSPCKNSAPEAQAEEPAPAVNVWETVPSGQHANGESGLSAELRAENTASSDADGTGTERESLRRKNSARGIGPVIAAAVAGSVCATAFYPHKSGREGLEVLRRFALLPPRSLAGAEPLTAATAEGLPDFGLIARIDVINGRTQDGRPCCMQAEKTIMPGRTEYFSTAGIPIRRGWRRCAPKPPQPQGAYLCRCMSREPFTIPPSCACFWMKAPTAFFTARPPYAPSIRSSAPCTPKAAAA